MECQIHTVFKPYKNLPRLTIFATFVYRYQIPINLHTPTSHAVTFVKWLLEDDLITKNKQMSIKHLCDINAFSDIFNDTFLILHISHLFHVDNELNKK